MLLATKPVPQPLVPRLETNASALLRVAVVGGETEGHLSLAMATQASSPKQELGRLRDESLYVVSHRNDSGA